jgi:protein-tyrosine phosphatase
MVYWFTWQLGTCAYYELKAAGFDCHESVTCDRSMNNAIAVYNLMDLEDGWNDPERLAGRMLMIIADLKAGRRVIVMCAAGISRSNGVAMGVLSAYHNLELDDAKRIVECLCPRANPMPDLMDAVKEAVQLINGLF